MSNNSPTMDGCYWVQVAEMTEYENLVPAEVDGDEVWVLGFDTAYDIGSVVYWGPPCK